MKKITILLTVLMMNFMYAVTYSPSYGPGEQWSPWYSTKVGFIVFDDITLNGEAVDSGQYGGGWGPTGTCDSEDCDILGVMYDGQCVGWTYMPIVDNVITVVVEMQDGITSGTENYPIYVSGYYYPVVTFNFYDASEGKMYYNVGSFAPVADGLVLGGVLDITGSVTVCSSDGFSFFGNPEVYCLEGSGCDLTSGGSAGAWDTFDAIGDATGTCAYEGCSDDTAVNTHAGASAGDAINDDGSCLYAGCSDVNATNHYDDGFDCAGDAGAADQSCCTYAPADLAISFDYYGFEVTASWDGTDSYTCSVDGGEAVACASGFGFDGAFNTDATLTVITDNGAVDAGGNSLTYGYVAIANPGDMPTPSVNSVDVTAGADGCVDVAFTEDFGYNGVTVTVDGQSASWATSPTTFCGLQAGTDYEASVTSSNQAGSDTATGSGSTTAYAEGQLVISAIEVSIYSILVTFSGAENYGGDANWMYTACANDICNSSPNTSISISSLAPTTTYAITTYAVSQYGPLSGDTGAGTTADPPTGAVWKFDITAEIAILGEEYASDLDNQIGFYYASQESCASANNGISTSCLQPASDGFDAYWDMPEPYLPTNNAIHFYIENDWGETNPNGDHWSHDIRALDDDFYAANNTKTFNGVVVAETGGLATVTIAPGGVTDGLVSAAITYVPVYALVNGGGHSGAYYKLERDAVTIPLTLQSNTPVSIDFIVGNLVPEQADGLSSSSDASGFASGADWKPGSDIWFDTDDSCDEISLEGVNFSDLNGSLSYDLTQCNSFEQRYPATSYTVASASVGSGSGMATGSHAAITDGSLADSEDNLEFSTSYTYTVTAHNRAGEGASTSTSLTTVANVDPAFTDLCINDVNNNNDCESVISSYAVGQGSGPEIDYGDIDSSDDVYLYHTYTTLHDGIGRLSAGGTDADGLDQSGTPMTINLASAYTDHEGYTLDASWSGDIDFDTDSDFADGNGSDVTFTVSEPNSGSGSSYNFDLAVTDNNWLTNGENGSNTINTNITVTILPEPNQNPVAFISIPYEQEDRIENTIYWQVPHNGDNEYTCDDLLAYDDQSCDDNRASITLSHDGSYDPDCNENVDPICEEYDFWWSETLMGMLYNDINSNGNYDIGEPCQGCSILFDPDGINPDITQGELSHDNNHSQRHLSGTYNWTLTVQDNYGAENTTFKSFYVLQEPNTRAYSNSITDSASPFEIEENEIHILPDSSLSTEIYLNSGNVFDFDGDNIRFTTTLNGDAIYESSGDCIGACETGGFSRNLVPGEYTVTTCSQDSYEGYEYLMYASPANVSLNDLDPSIIPTQNDPDCRIFTFIIFGGQGCTDENAFNYNEYVFNDCNGDNSCCDYQNIVSGCTDPEAYNYNESASIDDGTCDYINPYHHAVIDSIIDVPNDQGGYVYVYFNKSNFDTDSLRSEDYTVERNDNDNWVAVGYTSAYSQTQYTVLAPTINNQQASEYRIIASMDEGNYVSEVEQGYSVDNLDPAVPESLMVAFNDDNQIELNWNPAVDNDFQYFTIYRNGELLDYSIPNSFIDQSPPLVLEIEYSVSATDQNNNESLLSESVIITNYISGDVNMDGYVNVVDIVLMVEFIMDISDFTLSQQELADFNQDGIINIVDIVQLIHLILNENLSKGENPTYIDLSYNNNYIAINSDGKVAGLQLEYTGTIDINKYYLPEDWDVSYNDHTILIYSMSGTELIDNKLFDFTGEIELLSAVGLGWNGEEIQAGITLIPTKFALHPAYPNPFNPVTNISYDLPKDILITIDIYDVEGRKISTLTEGIRTAGNHTIEWNAEGYPSGVYFVKMNAGDPSVNSGQGFTQTQKLMLVK